MIAIRCGMQSEAKTFLQSNDGLDYKSYDGADGLKNLQDDIAGVDKPPLKFDGLLSWGTCGGIAPIVGVGQVVVPIVVEGTDHSCYYPDQKWRERILMRANGNGLPVLLPACKTLSDEGLVAATPAQRADLFKRYAATAVDEESIGVARLAKQHGLPFMVMRAVSDDWTDTIPKAALNSIEPDGSIDFMAIIKSIHDLDDIAELIKLAFQYDKALTSLDKLADALFPQIAGAIGA